MHIKFYIQSDYDLILKVQITTICTILLSNNFDYKVNFGLQLDASYMISSSSSVLLFSVKYTAN